MKKPVSEQEKYNETDKQLIVQQHSSKKSCINNAERFLNYDLDKYINDVEKTGLKKTWDGICKYVLESHENIPEFIDVKHFGELYEIGLAIQDKLLKKKSGQYFTPEDVAMVMSEWLLRCEGTVVCDVACGTGKLILTYLELIGYEQARELISSGNLYIYDFDEVALKVCKTAISLKYGLDISEKIHDVYGDFLSKKIKLPKDCKVISNPPYARIEEFGDDWDNSIIIKDTKELYSAFMEKMFSQSKSTVVITPFSFISGSKFYSLRKKMCDLGNGFIVSFDNVPGNIFCGRKHGIFNTNTANSVRAAITVFNKSTEKKGFVTSPLIRFKNEERKDVLQTKVLESMVDDEVQIIDNQNSMFKKVSNELSCLYRDWVNKSKNTLSNLITSHETKYLIDMPSTCRYYTTGSSLKLSRGGSIVLYTDNKETRDFLYCFINSSFAYWWWRIFDGGIVYPKNLLMTMPVPYSLLTEDDKTFFSNIADEMMQNESKYIITKVNAGSLQENIKFPEEYRNKINERIIKILGRNDNISLFDAVHSNSFLKN